MNQRLGKWMLFAGVTAMLLSGCTQLPGKSADPDNEENFGSEISEAAGAIGGTVRNSIGSAVGTATEAIENAAESTADRLNSSGMSKQLTFTASVQDEAALSLINSVGDVELKPGTGSDLKITATVTAYKTAGRTDHRQDILDNARVTASENTGEWKILTHAKNKPDTDLWTWANEAYGTSDLTVSYVLEVPDSFNRFDIESDVGRIKLRGLAGTYHISSDVGAISTENAVIEGSSEIVTDTGSITLDIAGMDSGSDLTVNSQVGSIQASLDSSVKCSIEANPGIGGVSGIPSGKSDVNGGGPLISLSSSVGSIQVAK